MAVLPTSGTNITLLSGVPFQSDYKNSRWFDTKTDQTTYFQSRNVVWYSGTEYNIQRVEHETFIRVNQNIESLRSANYCMFQNAEYNTKWFYAFVTRLEYKGKGLTHVHIELDVLQTWMFDMNFKPSYVVREHCPLWNADGTPVINTQDEGLYYGTDYETVYAEKYIPYPNIVFLIIVSKSMLHGTNAGQIKATQNGLPANPLSYYIHPLYLDGSGNPSVLVNGTNYTLSDTANLLSDIYTVSNAQNDVVSLYLTNYFGDNLNYSATAPNLSFGGLNYDVATIGTSNTIYLQGLFSYVDTVSHDFGNKYQHYNTVQESKLLMYPYTLTKLVDFRGNQVVLKNEYINNPNLILTVLGSLGTSNKVSYNVKDYLMDSGSPNPVSSTDKDAVSLENALIDNEPNDIPILSDYLSAYLQGHRNQIQNAKNTIVWDGAMNAVGSGVGAVVSGAKGNWGGLASSAVNIVKGMGDSIQELRGIQAKLKDISNVPPSMVKMGSNSEFDFGNGINGVYVVQKQITSEYRTKLSDFFKMFGYKLNQVKIPNFHTRQSWNYVETKNCLITGDFNNEDLNELKSVFDNGITLWHTNDVGNYSLANGVI